MLVVLLVTLVAYAVPAVNGCSLIDGQVELEVLGGGFHRTLYVRTNISSMTRLINCSITYLFQIPQGAYVDVDRLPESLYRHCFMAKSFDVEEPAGSSKVPHLQPIYFHSGRLLSKVFVVKDSFSFPIHVRYHPPADGTKEHKPTNAMVLVESPRVYLRCESNDSILVEGSCRNRVEKVPCGCSKSPKCPYIHLSTTPFTVEIGVPVGSVEKLPIVLLITGLAICFGMLAITYVTISANKTKID